VRKQGRSRLKGRIGVRIQRSTVKVGLRSNSKEGGGEREEQLQPGGGAISEKRNVNSTESLR